jgi:hypothetical protein
MEEISSILFKRKTEKRKNNLKFPCSYFLYIFTFSFSNMDRLFHEKTKKGKEDKI